MAKVIKTVFLSHNSRDKATAREIGLFLAAEGVNVWFDEWKIPAGHSISSSVSQALAASSHLLLLWSKHARRSRWVRRELFSGISRHLDSGRLQLIPVRLDNTPLPPLIADLKYVRYSGGTETDRFAIVSAVTHRRAAEEFTKAIVRKYKELIGGGPLGLRACPECGSSALDWKKDPGYAHCKECGWD
jgi:hypothetical protein